jgi:alpha-glucosidase
MVWEGDNQNGGFSAAKPWLPVTAAHLGRAVGVQNADPASMLAHYRRALAFRAAHPVLRTGDMTALMAAGDLVSFRRTGAQDIFCAYNLGEGQVSAALPAGDWAPLGQDLGAMPAVQGHVTLGPWEFCLMIKQ